MGLAGLKEIEHWSTKPQEYTLFDLKAVVNSFLTSLHLQKHVSTRVDDNEKLHYYINKTEIGTVCAIDKSMREAFEIKVPAFAAEFSISEIYNLRQNLPAGKYEPVSKFPAFDFDFGVIVDNAIRAEALLNTITQNAGKTLDNIQIFDVFESESLGKNKKNIAFRLSFLDKNKTLTINDVEPIIEKVLKVLDKKFSAKLRS